MKLAKIARRPREQQRKQILAAGRYDWTPPGIPVAPGILLFASLGICKPYIDSGHTLFRAKASALRGETEPAGKDKRCRERLLAMPRAIPVFGQ